MNKIIKGKVIHGKGLGHKVNMPTANIEIKEEDVKLGVYASITSFDNESHLSLTNIGTRPSIDDDKTIKAETYILDYSGNLYDKIIEVELCHFLREIKKFSGIEEVHEQVKKDIEQTRILLSEIK